MTIAEMSPQEALHEFFGFTKFKGTQEAIVKSVLAGKDTFVIMPTGGGKSLCYQLPAIMSEGVAIIISPLIALMKNQVDLVRNYSDKDSIAHFLNSSLNRTERNVVIKDIKEGKTKMLYVAPETLTKQDTVDLFKEVKVSFIAVDEAHCISEWGHDFRPEYRRIREIITALNQKFPIIALTATATPKVQSDIVKTLELKKPNIFISSFNRPNLYYEIRSKKTPQLAIKNMVQFIKQRPGKSGIIYVINRKTCDD
ncbi:MAG: ATP-dependent DNA helicase RecQ, partial [Chitinophagales bacterium]|nr:ATP-dependent DNA helicase RecQ [Chitinophagales bacterium]